MQDTGSTPSLPGFNPSNSLQQFGGEDISSLRVARDAAVRAAQDAVYNTTRLTRLLTILSEPAPLETLLDRVLATLSELFSADIVVLLDPAGTGTFYPLASIGLPEDMVQQKFSEAEDGYVAAAMGTGVPVLITEANKDSNVDRQLRELGVETTVWMPVIGSYAARGVLILARCHPVPFAHADVNLLTAMAYRIGLVLEQAQHSIQLERIVRTGRDIGRYLDEASVCAEAAQRFPAVVGAESSALILLSPDGKFRCVARLGLDLVWIPALYRLSERLLEDCSRAGIAPYCTPNVHSVADPSLQELLKNCPIRALLAVPILREECIEGFLYATRYSITSFNANTLTIAMLYGGQVSAALENARLYRAVRDELTERNRAELALRASDERFRALIRSVSDVIAILAADGTICYASPAVEVMWGCQADVLLGQRVFDRIHPDDCDGMRNLLSMLLERPNTTLTGSMRLLHGWDDWRVFDVILTNLLKEPAVAGIVATFHDITERKIYEQELTKLAYRDPLTGLFNRAYFVEKLRHALTHADSSGSSVAVIFFDLDNFKIVNDSLGHDRGDEVLQAVSDRIRNCLRREDTAARLGGDEFTVLVENVSSIGQVISIANRLISALREPIRLKEHEIFISCSLGIAVSTPFQDKPEDLLRKADLAMYDAKGSGKDCYAIFDVEMNTAAMERLELETELRQALRRKELRVYYQPILSLESNHIVEVEALVRWQHPGRGLVAPVGIIPVAEETGLIIEIGQWVLEEACRQIRSWQERYPSDPPLLLSVNLSARQFQHDGLVSDINEAILDSGLDPSNLILEITESSLIQDPEAMIAKLQALKNIGVRLAIDDFGTGYASLSYLKQFPVDVLKIDRSFVQGIVRDSRDRSIVQSVVALAKAFGLEIIGEGIETDEQAAQLRDLGCSLGQGYLFARPLPAEEFENQFDQ